MDYTTDDFSGNQRTNGGARDEVECYINYTRSELKAMLQRQREKSEHRKHLSVDALDITVLNNKHGYNRK